MCLRCRRENMQWGAGAWLVLEVVKNWVNVHMSRETEADSIIFALVYGSMKQGASLREVVWRGTRRVHDQLRATPPGQSGSLGRVGGDQGRLQKGTCSRGSEWVYPGGEACQLCRVTVGQTSQGRLYLLISPLSLFISLGVETWGETHQSSQDPAKSMPDLWYETLSTGIPWMRNAWSTKFLAVSRCH